MYYKPNMARALMYQGNQMKHFWDRAKPHWLYSKNYAVTKYFCGCRVDLIAFQLN